MTSGNVRPKRSNGRFVSVVIGGTLFAFYLALVACNQWGALWINAIGALLVAVGGVAGCLRHYEIANKDTGAVTWSCVMLGGAVITGASTFMALGN